MSSIRARDRPGGPGRQGSGQGKGQAGAGRGKAGDIRTGERPQRVDGAEKAGDSIK